MNLSAIAYATAIYRAASPVIRIHGVGGERWKRNVSKGSRIGPWLPARYEIVDIPAWEARSPCLYLVTGSDAVIRYVGISRNRLKDRLRVSPAHHAETLVRLQDNQLFHSQCWKHIERESSSNPKATFEVRSISGNALLPILENLGPPLSALVVFRDDGEGIVHSVERWLCNHKSAGLVSWNVAMTGQ